MSTWIVPSNPRRFRLIDWIKNHESVYWVQHVNFAPGDTIYIYSSAPFSRIMFAMVVEDVNLPFGDYIKDAAYWIDPLDFESGKTHNRYCKFRLQQVSDSHKLDLGSLIIHGLKAAPQSCQHNIPEQLINYIEKEF